MLSCIKSNSNNELEGEVYIYGDREGLIELISYINYLLEQSEDSSFDLSDGNELSQIHKDDVRDGYSNVAYIKIVNTEREK